MFGRTYFQFILGYDISTYVSVLGGLMKLAHAMFISGFLFISIYSSG